MYRGVNFSLFLLDRRVSMKQHVLRLPAVVLAAFAIVCMSAAGVTAKIEWAELKTVDLKEKPRDIAISKDGSTAYILGDGKILIYSSAQGKVTDTIPVKGNFSEITVSPKDDSLFLTDEKAKKLKVIQITKVHEIPVGNSPIIGEKNAPVTVYAFLDYQ